MIISVVTPTNPHRKEPLSNFVVMSVKNSAVIIFVTVIYTKKSTVVAPGKLNSRKLCFCR